jgi:hypothetical protein
VTDWVQTGRYTGAADPLTVVGGPTTEQPGGGLGDSVAKDGSDRSLLVGSSTWYAGQTGVVSVILKGSGSESALGFSLMFDAARFSLVGASKGVGAGGAMLNANLSEAGTGKVGVALGLSSGSFPAGTNEVLKLTLVAKPGAAIGTTAVSFADLPVPREISDGAALPLGAAYENGSVTVLPFPELAIAAGGGNVGLTWPAWATNFNLQANVVPGSTGWTNSGATPVLTNGEFRVNLPPDAPALFYRLAQP